MMEIAEALAILRRTPATMRAMLSDLPDAWLHAGAGRADWGPYDILGHLIHGDRTNWTPRARMMLDDGASRAFEPFDREAQFALTGRPVAELLDEFAALRESNVAVVEGLPPDALDVRGLHPSFGEVTLGQLLAAWAVHDLNHVAQAAEVMARRWREEIGPWRAFLPIVDREPLTD